MNQKKVKEVWGVPDAVMVQAEAESKKFDLKHGMFASVPLICKGNACPYRTVCTVNQAVLPTMVGHRCPIEIGAIMTRFEHWCNHFNIDTKDDVIDDRDIVDATLIKDLVDNEIQVMRAENRLAISADFIARTITTVDNKGKAYYKDEVSPESVYKQQLLDKRYKILQLLNSTRKDKAKDVKLELTPGQQAMSIFNKISSKLDGVEV